MSKILVHICCAVDSHYFLQKLQNDYPNHKLIGFFYDPNIHPYSEYRLRLLETQRSCDMLNIELIEGEYDTSAWLKAVSGLEHEPEKGARCSVCFDKRFEVSAKQASKIGAQFFTSTLLTSPKKSLSMLKNSGDALGKQYSISFLAPNYRKASGTQEQNIMAKDAKLYRQDYCGCVYALTIQRQEQEKLADELFVPISKQIQPESIEARLELYEQRLQLEQDKKPYRIIKERFLNYRLKWGILKSKKQTVHTHILPYSTLKKGYTRGKIDYQHNNISYLNRDEVKFITLEHYNLLANSNYKTIDQLLISPPTYQKEIEIRGKITSTHNDLSTILVVKKPPTSKIELWVDADLFEDTKERLLQLK